MVREERWTLKQVQGDEELEVPAYPNQAVTAAVEGSRLS